MFISLLIISAIIVFSCTAHHGYHENSFPESVWAVNRFCCICPRRKSSLMRHVCTPNSVKCSISLPWATYNLYFHPLSKHSWPKSWAISRDPYALSLASEDFHTKVKQIHDQYGEKVRLAPNEVSFVNAQALQDIHGHHSDFLKSNRWIPPQAMVITR